MLRSPNSVSAEPGEYHDLLLDFVGRGSEDDLDSISHPAAGLL
jgi:hypothetical protein